MSLIVKIVLILAVIVIVVFAAWFWIGQNSFVLNYNLARYGEGSEMYLTTTIGDKKYYLGVLGPQETVYNITFYDAPNPKAVWIWGETTGICKSVGGGLSNLTEQIVSGGVTNIVPVCTASYSTSFSSPKYDCSKCRAGFGNNICTLCSLGYDRATIFSTRIVNKFLLNGGVQNRYLSAQRQSVGSSTRFFCMSPENSSYSHIWATNGDTPNTIYITDYPGTSGVSYMTNILSRPPLPYQNVLVPGTDKISAKYVVEIIPPIVPPK